MHAGHYTWASAWHRVTYTDAAIFTVTAQPKTGLNPVRVHVRAR
jgi:hypothetical protein